MVAEASVQGFVEGRMHLGLNEDADTIRVIEQVVVERGHGTGDEVESGALEIVEG